MEDSALQTQLCQGRCILRKKSQAHHEGPTPIMRAPPPSGCQEVQQHFYADQRPRKPVSLWSRPAPSETQGVQTASPSPDPWEWWGGAGLSSLPALEGGVAVLGSPLLPSPDPQQSTQTITWHLGQNLNGWRVCFPLISTNL